MQSGLLSEFASRGLLGCFSVLNEPAGQGVLSLERWVLPPDEQQPALRIEDDAIDAQSRLAMVHGRGLVGSLVHVRRGVGLGNQ